MRPGDELAVHVGFDEIVVGPEQQAGDAAVGLGASARQEDDGQLGAELGPERVAHLVTREVAERDLEDHRSRGIRPGEGEGLLAGLRLEDPEPDLRQR